MRSSWIAAFVFLTGCCSTSMGLSTLSDSETNISNLTQVYRGMTQGEVLRAMRHPYEYNTVSIGEDVYDIWFYVTSPTILGQSRMVPQNLTPLVFKNGILIGRGYNAYDAILVKRNAPPKEPAAKKHRENKALEKSLEAMNKRSDPPPPPMTRTLDEEVPPDEDNPGDHPEKTPEKPEKKKAFDKEGNRMNEDASEQDFDYW